MPGQDCTTEAVRRRADDAAREGNETALHCLVKPRSRQLNQVLLTPPSEARPLGLLVDLALGSALGAGADVVRQQVGCCRGAADAVRLQVGC